MLADIVTTIGLAVDIAGASILYFHPPRGFLPIEQPQGAPPRKIMLGHPSDDRWARWALALLAGGFAIQLAGVWIPGGP